MFLGSVEYTELLCCSFYVYLAGVCCPFASFCNPFSNNVTTKIPLKSIIAMLRYHILQTQKFKSHKQRR